MSLKPLKKSDRNKSWVSPRRDRAILIAPDYHLIITEGTKTEPLYFAGLKEDIDHNYKGKIQIEGSGQSNLALLQKAMKIVEKSSIEYRHVWLVYDLDDFPKDSFDNTVSKCNSISNNEITYHALWSNECIELWFLLHYEFLQSGLHREAYFPKISKHLNSKYKKNRDDIYNILKPHLNTAIKNAKKLKEFHGKETAPSQCNPCSAVYELFEFLDVYLKE